MIIAMAVISAAAVLDIRLSEGGCRGCDVRTAVYYKRCEL